MIHGSQKARSKKIHLVLLGSFILPLGDFSFNYFIGGATQVPTVPADAAIHPLARQALSDS